ncbi:Gfo/Idh/MocA family oxidoreductase [Hellea balneolensis]|uniref:hypothetical protein n=1 Tax=Hellea balneolensis TaxID=287478 RepID=UPI0003F9C7BD|nr:hypothetical protein [Hellea balneolensis]
MANIVISGCGNIGSRLLQSVSNIDDTDIGKLDIYGVDPFQSSLDLSTERFHQENKGGNNLRMSTDAAKLPAEADLLIVSVDAANRLAALTTVLEHCKPKAIILEKILFNKFEEFETVQAILDDLGVPCWVNCSRNIWPGYQSLKETLGGKPVNSYTVSGSDWGLGCNAIHFIAALEYVAGDTVISLEMDKDTALVRESKRAGYKEVTGTLRGITASGGTLSLSSLPVEGQAISVILEAGDDNYEIAEGKTIALNGGGETPFPMLYTSQLTAPLVKILKEGQSDLPSYTQSVHQHKVLFKALNNVFYGAGNSEVQCPVT